MQWKAKQCKEKALCVSTKGWDFLMEKKPAMTFARNGKQTKKAEGWTEDKKHPH
jgi:hypothetical protein